MAQLVQHVLGLVTILLIVITCKEVFSSWRAGLCAGTLYTLSGTPLFFEGEILIVTFFTFLCTLLLFLIIKALNSEGKSQWGWWLSCGVAHALAAQARPNILLFLPIYIILCFFLYIRERKTCSSLMPMIAVVSWFAVQGLFGFVNQAQSGHYQFTTSAGGINFYLGNRPGADGLVPRQPSSVTYSEEYLDSIQVFARQDYQRRMLEQNETPSTDPSDISRFWIHQTFKEVNGEYTHFFKQFMRKTLLLLSYREFANNKSLSFIKTHESYILKFLFPGWWLLLLLVPFGIFHAHRSGNTSGLLTLCVYILLMSTSIILFFVNARFRLPIWPALAILSGGGCLEIYGAIKRKSYRLLSLESIPAILLLPLIFVNWLKVPADDHSRDFFFRSIAYYETGRYEEALGDAKRGLELDPSNMDLLFQLGNSQYASGKFEDALQSYQEYAKENPEEYRVWNNLGATCESLNLYERALTSYEKAFTINPQHYSSQINYGLLAIKLQRTELLEASLNKFEERFGQTPEIISLKALLAYVENDRERFEELTADLERNGSNSWKRMFDEFNEFRENE